MSFRFVPYIESPLIEGFTYFFIIPIEIAIFIFLVNRVLKKKLWSLFLIPYVLATLWVTWFSLHMMAWPTYWFASNHDVLVVDGVRHYGSRSGHHEMYFLKSNDETRYSVIITQKTYDYFLNSCKYTGFPVVSNSWWAGDVVFEEQIEQSILDFCIEPTSY